MRAACAAQVAHNDEDTEVGDSDRHPTGRFAAVGLHLLHGLVLAARGNVDEALDEFGREPAAGERRHVYGR